MKQSPGGASKLFSCCGISLLLIIVPLRVQPCSCTGHALILIPVSCVHSANNVQCMYGVNDSPCMYSANNSQHPTRAEPVFLRN